MLLIQCRSWSESIAARRDRSDLPKINHIDAMADSWEDEGEEIVLQANKPRLRADAPAFTFNPGASSFQPPGYDAQPMQPATFAAPQPPGASYQQAPAPVPSFQQAAFAPRTAGPPPGFAASAPEVDAVPREPERPSAAEDHPMEDAQYPLNRAGVQPESERDPPGEHCVVAASIGQAGLH